MSVLNKDTGAFFKKLKKTMQRGGLNNLTFDCLLKCALLDYYPDESKMHELTGTTILFFKSLISVQRNPYIEGSDTTILNRIPAAGSKKISAIIVKF